MRSRHDSSLKKAADMFGTMRNDLRSAIRNLRGSPGFSAIAILSLAIGIGATTAVFSFINTMVWKPLPFREPQQLADVYEHHPLKVCEGCGVGASYADFTDWRSRTRAFSEMAAYNEMPAVVSMAGGGERHWVAYVSASMFPLLGVEPARGRVFGAEEDRATAPRVALISENLWRTRFNSETSLEALRFRVEGVEYRVIGVMPRRFAFPMYAEVWAPLAQTATMVRDQRDIGVVGRLASGRSFDEARVEMRLIGRQLQAEHPEANGGWNAFVVPLRSDMADDYIGQMPVLLGAVLFVLLIACANLASLLLARAVGRRRELAVRAALGAQRVTLVRQLMTESMVVALIGGAIGLLLALWSVELVGAAFRSRLPLWMEFTIDWRVAAFAAAISLVAAAAFGLLPALRASRPDVYDVLKDAGRSSGDGRGSRRLRDSLVVAELTLALVLLACAGVFMRAFVKSHQLQLGYDVAGMLRGDVAPPAGRYASDAQRTAFADALIERLHTVPGLASASLTSLYVRAWPGTPAGSPQLQDAPDSIAERLIHHVNNVTPEYFAAYQITPSLGRTFLPTDRAGTAPVVVINRGFADQAWPGKSPIGKQIRIGAAGDDPWRTIVGVIPDVAYSPVGRGMPSLVFLPYAQHPVTQPEGGLTLAIRTTVDEAALAPQVRRAISAVEEDASVDDLMSMRAYMVRYSSITRYSAYVSTALAAFAMLLASIGIYGTVAFTVSQRTHEIGVRMALGADAAGVQRMVVMQAMKLTAVGLAIGLPIALMIPKLLLTMHLLFNASATAPVTFALVAVIFTVITLFAAWLPARRASRVDPLVALRSE